MSAREHYGSGRCASPDAILGSAVAVGLPRRPRHPPSSTAPRKSAITDKKHRTNEQIRVPQVRLVDAEGEQVGVVPTDEARQRAEDEGLDLVEVAPNATPPVCRLMDYGKYLYRLQKEKKQKTHQPQLKEVKFRPKIDDHDYDFKFKHILRFLREGNMVKGTVMFRGREVVHPELGREILDRVLEDLEEEEEPYRIERHPSMEGRQMIMVLTPRRD